MGAFVIDTRTLYLEVIILAAVVWPSGFGYSLYAAWRGRPQMATTALLAVLTVPFLAVVPVVWMLRPGIFVFAPPKMSYLGLAVILAPIALLIEYVVQALALFLREGTFRRRVAIHSFWQSRLPPRDHFLMATIGVGEELFYRMIWCGVLASMSVPLGWALVISSIAYGVNHLAFGPISAMSKTITGVLYGSLYLFGGSIWPSIIMHVLQNLTLFAVTAKNDA